MLRCAVEHFVVGRFTVVIVEQPTRAASAAVSQSAWQSSHRNFSLIPPNPHHPTHRLRLLRSQPPQFRLCSTAPPIINLGSIWTWFLYLISYILYLLSQAIVLYLISQVLVFYLISQVIVLCIKKTTKTNYNNYPKVQFTIHS